MIADVLGSYLDSLEEREFDLPFMALLRARGFTDIHFLHGSFEFGKDFIAKGYEDGLLRQFAFQTKAGDVGLSEWRGARGQLDELRTNALAHPSFDPDLPRRAVFVTTGRLIGGARLASQEYLGHLKKLREVEFKVWDREDLVALMSQAPEVSLAGATDGPLLGLIGRIDAGDLQEIELERFSRRWVAPAEGASLWRAAIEAALVAQRLRHKDRLDLACSASLCLLRAAWAFTHGQEPPNEVGLAVADLGRGLFLHYASDLWAKCGQGDFDPLAFIHAHEIPTAFITYPVRCLRLVEILGLLGLFMLEADELAADEIGEYISHFFECHPGASHPISDRWAVSLISPVLLLARTGRKEKVVPLLTEVVKWVGDRYEKGGFGLAKPYANVEEEVNCLLGYALEHVILERRSESYVSTVVLDLAAILKEGDFFRIARNEFLAVNVYSCVVETQDTPGQYVLGATDKRYEINVPYTDEWLPVDGWKVAPHHNRNPASYYLNRLGRHWDHLAISSVLRDRHFLPACRALLE